jgi:hypothetical protein
VVIPFSITVEVPVVDCPSIMCAQLPKDGLGDQPAAAQSATAHAPDGPTELLQQSMTTE